MSHIKILIRDQPHRAIALATSETVLIFRHSPHSTDHSGAQNTSQTSLGSNGSEATPRCIVEFSPRDAVDLTEYRSLSSLAVHGTLGLITINGDVFLSVVSAANKVASVRPGETVQRIISVDFHCLSSSSYDNLLHNEVNSYDTESLTDDGFDYGRKDAPLEHPCLTLKKLLSGGTFYYSTDFDLTRRLQDRFSDHATVALDSLDAGFLWNSFMIQPLVDFRSRLSQRERDALDSSKLLTSAIRGFCYTINIPPQSSPARNSRTGLPSTLTLISRLSCRRAGTRFNSRGIDDDGNVANFVESETVFWTPSGLCFSYAQVRGSVPIFWEQQSGLLPGQQKITITRSEEATQPAFDKHVESLEYNYGAVHVVNLLSVDKPGELELTSRFHRHIVQSPLRGGREKDGHELLRETQYDFHAETKGPGGYEAASQIKRYIQGSADSFAYWLSEEVEEAPHDGHGRVEQVTRRAVVVLQQEGVFRTNCLDCLDRTNLVQTIISQMAIAGFLEHREDRASQDFWVRHSSLWADNGDALSRIYAGTGALKSSFTRHGKMSIAGALADARKSATRMYINNFADKGRQNTIDMLLGRLMGQVPVHLYDPINDYVQSELSRRIQEYSSNDMIHIWVGTFNLNGRTEGMNDDLSSWLCPDVGPALQDPELVVVGFQEIVELSPQQIMSTDPTRRQAWENSVKRQLNENAQRRGSEEYVLLRGGQLVGASLSIFAKASVLKYIKNVEGSVKKTGMSGMAGNKGAVAVRMDFSNTSLCFVTAHLAAGFANYDERNRDYRTISQGLRFQRNRSIEDHDNVIWLGDFNYRVGLGNDEVRKLCMVGDLERLYENDQLNIQMVNGRSFPFYSEARITFMPTYRFDIGTDQYDTSEKARIPAWCDRILYKGTYLRQHNYDSAPLKFSDHRPVYATFQCAISRVDEKKKDQLSADIYQQRKAFVGKTIANTNLEDTDDEDLIGYDAIEPGLPPASSDRRKWWLDNGMPSQSTIKPPAPHLMPNPRRPSNPFTLSREPDWIEVKESGSFPDTLSSSPVGRADSILRRKLPPPLVPSPGSTEQPPAQPPRPTSQLSTMSLPTRSSASPANVNRKPAPPVPKKPTTLAGSTPSSPDTEKAPQQYFPPPPPPRRSNTQLPEKQPLRNPRLANVAPPPARSSSVGSRNTQNKMRDVYADRAKDDMETAPTLPPRRKTNNVLMDQEEGIEGLKDWEVLRPV